MVQAVSPRLVKQEGAGNRDRMLELALLTTKYAFFLACFWMIPLFVELPTLLKLWLKTPPAHTLVFCRVALLIFICDQLSSGFSTVVLAIGNIARYQTIIGFIHITTLPLAFILVKFGFNQDAVMFCSLLTIIIASASRGLIVRRLTDLPYSAWLNKVVVRGIAGMLPAALYASTLAWVMPPSLLRAVILFISTGVVTITGAFYTGMSHKEREYIRGLAAPLKRKVLLRIMPEKVPSA